MAICTHSSVSFFQLPDGSHKGMCQGCLLSYIGPTTESVYNTFFPEAPVASLEPQDPEAVIGGSSSYNVSHPSPKPSADSTLTSIKFFTEAMLSTMSWPLTEELKELLSPKRIPSTPVAPDTTGRVFRED